MCENLLSRPVASAVTFIWKLIHDNEFYLVFSLRKVEADGARHQS